MHFLEDAKHVKIYQNSLLFLLVTFVPLLPQRMLLHHDQILSNQVNLKVLWSLLNGLTLSKLQTYKETVAMHIFFKRENKSFTVVLDVAFFMGKWWLE